MKIFISFQIRTDGAVSTHSYSWRFNYQQRVPNGSWHSLSLLWGWNSWAGANFINRFDYVTATKLNDLTSKWTATNVTATICNHMTATIVTATMWLQLWDCNHLTNWAKWLSVRLWTKMFWVRVQLQSLKLQILRMLPSWSSLTYRQL